MGLAPAALWVFFFSSGHGATFTPLMMFVGFFTSLIVGAFEEYAFRGPLLYALRQRLSLFTTIVLSNVVFAIYHVQAQPTGFWVAIFLTGVIYANLRFRGVSLGWLALIHGVIDAFYFLFPGSSSDPFGFYGLVLQAGLLVYAVMTFPRSKATEALSNESLETSRRPDSSLDARRLFGRAIYAPASWSAQVPE